MVVAVRTDITVQDLRLHHTLADHPLGYLGIVRFLLLDFFTLQTYWLVRVGRQDTEIIGPYSRIARGAGYGAG